MKLEAVDLSNTECISVATVTQVAGRTVWVQPEHINARGEQVFDVASHDLFPVGWCESNGYPLETPGIRSKFFAHIGLAMQEVP